MIITPTGAFKAHLAEQNLTAESYEVDVLTFEEKYLKNRQDHPHETDAQVWERTAYECIWGRYGVPDPEKSVKGTAAAEYVNGQRIVEMHELGRKLGGEFLPQIASSLNDFNAMCERGLEQETQQHAELKDLLLDIARQDRNAIRNTVVMAGIDIRETVRYFGIRIAILVFLLVLATLFGPKAHASDIDVIKIKQAGTTKATYASPFSLDFTAGCTVTKTASVAGIDCSGASGAPTGAQYLTLATDGTLTNERVLTPRDGLSVTDGGAGGNYTVDWDMDPGIAWFDEEFCGNGAANSSLATYGWRLGSLGGATAVINSNSTDQTDSAPCVIVMGPNDTTTLHGGFIDVGEHNNTIGILGPLGASANPWTSQFRAGMRSSTANVDFRMGFVVPAVALTPNDFYGLRFSTTAADTNFMFEVRVGGTPTTIDTGIAADTNFHRVKIESPANGTIKMTLYSSTGTVQFGPKTFCSSGCDATVTPPTGNVTAAIIQGNSGAPAAARFAMIDFVKFKKRGIAR